jgi:hypothetical protein
MNIQSYGTIIVPFVGFPLGGPKKKCHLDVAAMESHKVYYKKGSGASFQKLRVM